MYHCSRFKNKTFAAHFPLNDNCPNCQKEHQSCRATLIFKVVVSLLDKQILEFLCTNWKSYNVFYTYVYSERVNNSQNTTVKNMWLVGYAVMLPAIQPCMPNSELKSMIQQSLSVSQLLRHSAMVTETTKIYWTNAWVDRNFMAAFQMVCATLQKTGMNLTYIHVQPYSVKLQWVIGTDYSLAMSLSHTRLISSPWSWLIWTIILVLFFFCSFSF